MTREIEEKTIFFAALTAWQLHPSASDVTGGVTKWELKVRDTIFVSLLSNEQPLKKSFNALQTL